MDKNAEIEQYFAFWEKPFPIAAEHDHWVRWGSLLRVLSPNFMDTIGKGAGTGISKAYEFSKPIRLFSFVEFIT